MSQVPRQNARVVKSTYYSNWGDLFGYPIAHFILPFIMPLSFITPNNVTIISFVTFLVGCVFLIVSFPYHLIASGICVLFGYIGDDLDGQLARARQQISVVGDYLDKILDVSKIFFITFFVSLSVYNKTNDIIYILLGFIACFFFLFRYYIKLETMFSLVSQDKEYLIRSAEKKKEVEKKMDALYVRKTMSLKGALYSFWIKNRTIFFVDEAEFAIFTALGAFVNKLEIVLWVLAISQVTIACFRFYERGYQLHRKSEKLLLPMRK